MKIDADVMAMTLSQARREIMKCRRAMRQELGDNGNRRCWLNLLKSLPEGKTLQPIDIPEDEFLRNCRRYRRRQDSLASLTK